MESLTDSLSVGYLVVAGITSLIGTGAFIYGKKMEDMKCIFLGILLCLVSYFVTDPLYLTLVSIPLVAGLFSEKISWWLQRRSMGEIEEVPVSDRTTPRIKGRF